MSVYDFEMEMCSDMQVDSLIHELELCKEVGETTGRVVTSRYPSAPRNDSLFDSMRLYAKLDDDGKVELSGAVFYRNHGDGDSKTTRIIKTFPDIDACLEWLRCDPSEYIASKL
jgi:hypothetical protein